MKEKEKILESLEKLDKIEGVFYVLSYEWWKRWMNYIKSEEHKIKASGRSSELSKSWNEFLEVVAEKVYGLHNIH